MSWLKNKFLFVSILFVLAIKLGHTNENIKKWSEEQLKKKKVPTDSAIISQRNVLKSKRWSILGGLARSSRNDYLDSLNINLSARYFFNEFHGWEVAHLDLPKYGTDSTAEEIKNQTGFVKQSLKAKYTLSSSYVYSPIYGKYSWGKDHLVNFDLYALMGLGLRVNEESNSTLATAGIGINNYLFNQNLSLSIQYRAYMYSENYEDNLSSTLIVENQFQLGLSWLL